ncbi:hypothetical protein DBV15_08970 [Temnothorax longispinosus]|uniref:Uncharacterized protein n=1 Tax=Temnothorax longispinosus TaxID=300112 RepID=A0A4S2KPT7_9HYME|nr:hypothetical protein DBV15_08970 [Temnothorax longispinosus]
MPDEHCQTQNSCRFQLHREKSERLEYRSMSGMTKKKCGRCEDSSCDVRCRLFAKVFIVDRSLSRKTPEKGRERGRAEFCDMSVKPSIQKLATRLSPSKNDLVPVSLVNHLTPVAAAAYSRPKISFSQSRANERITTPDNRMDLSFSYFNRGGTRTPDKFSDSAGNFGLDRFDRLHSITLDYRAKFGSCKFSSGISHEIRWRDPRPVFLERARATHQFLGNYVVGDEYQIAPQTHPTTVTSDPVRKRNRNPGCLWEKERERGRENDGTRTVWDAHVRSQGRSGAINHSGRFISRRAATAATRFRECSRGDLAWKRTAVVHLRDELSNGEKAGEADRDKGEDFGAAGTAGAALGQDVVLQGFVEEQLEAQE